MRCWLRPIHCVAMAVSLIGCTAHVAPPASVPDAAALSVASCRSLYRDLDAWVKGASVGDAQSARITGYPYLRIDRFLAADEVKPDAGSEDFDAWVKRLRDLDMQARKFELQNLPDDFNGKLGELFQPDGLVHGTERGERWFFWPMGIAESGAMRQWGHHATLFVGKRHFDEPHLIERYFLSAGGG